MLEAALNVLRVDDLAGFRRKLDRHDTWLGLDIDGLQLARTIRAGIAPSPANPSAILWNPLGATFEEAIAALNVPIQSAAILGGTDVFGRFLDRYTVFFLSRIAGVRLPGGRPVFPQVPAQTPEAVLAEHGLRDKGCELSDPAARLIISRWERPA